MNQRITTGLDNPVFYGRIKTHRRREIKVAKRSKPTYCRVLTDVMPKSKDAVAVAKNPIETPKKIDKTATEKESNSTKDKVETLNIIVKSPKKSKLLPAMAVVLFLVGIGVSFWSFRSSDQAVADIQSAVAQEQPEEAEPTQDDIHDYTVAPDLPRFIRINNIDVFARVSRVGMGADNKLQAPANIHDAGWYENSSKPGEAGAVLVDGHVSGPSQPGVFYNLKELVAGDIIEIERGDGKKFEYEVVVTNVYEKQDTDMLAALNSVDPGKPGLNLITCTGRFDAAENDFEDRLIVFAVQR